MTIKNNLFKLRGDARQSEIAAAIGISQSAYSMAETGQGILPFPAVWKLCAYYDIKPEDVYPAWLLKEVYGIDAEPPKPKVKTTVSVKIPVALAEEVDRLITNGQYISRADFIVSAVRDKLHG